MSVLVYCDAMFLRLPLALYDGRVELYLLFLPGPAVESSVGSIPTLGADSKSKGSKAVSVSQPPPVVVNNVRPPPPSDLSLSCIMLTGPGLDLLI
jgi:hypothetical protein